MTFKTTGLSSNSAPCNLTSRYSICQQWPDSAVFCMETTTDHHDSFPMHCWLSPISLVLNIEHIFWNFLSLSPSLHQQILPHEQMLHFYLHSQVNYTTSCSFKLFNNPVDTISRWRDTKGNLSLILSPRQNKNHQRREK